MDHQTPRDPEDAYHFDGPVEALQESSVAVRLTERQKQAAERAAAQRRLIGAVNDHSATVFWRRWLAWWGAT